MTTDFQPLDSTTLNKFRLNMLKNPSEDGGETQTDRVGEILDFLDKIESERTESVNAASSLEGPGPSSSTTSSKNLQNLFSIPKTVFEQAVPTKSTSTSNSGKNLKSSLKGQARLLEKRKELQKVSDFTHSNRKLFETAFPLFGEGSVFGNNAPSLFGNAASDSLTKLGQTMTSSIKNSMANPYDTLSPGEKFNLVDPKLKRKRALFQQMADGA